MYAINCHDAVRNLKNFGLCEYEAKVYFTLQVKGKTRAGILWKNAGVPQSKIYCILDSLEMKKLIETTIKHPREVKAKSFLRFANEYLTERKILLREIDESIKESRATMRDYGRHHVFR